MAEEMRSRERILATVHGEEVDRFPVWLKMTTSTWQSSQPEPYRSMGERELLEACGCDLMLSSDIDVEPHNPHVSRRTEKRSDRWTTIIETPDGALVSESGFDPYTGSWHPTKYMVESAADLAALRWLYRDTSYHADPVGVEDARTRQQECERLGALTCSGVGPGPLMALVEEVCGPENTTYLECDEPELFAETVQLMHQDRLRLLQILLDHQVADTCWMTEDTSSTLISPKQFETWCVPHLRDYGRMMLDHGTIPVHHMCGTLNAFLEQIDRLPALVNEAYTTRPLGNVSLAEGRRRMPSKALWGGTNATLWLEPVEQIVATVAEDLANCPDTRKIFLTSAGVLPPPVSFAKAREPVAQMKRL